MEHRCGHWWRRPGRIICEPRRFAVVQKRVGVGAAAAALVSWIVLAAAPKLALVFLWVMPALVTLWSGRAFLNLFFFSVEAAERSGNYDTRRSSENLLAGISHATCSCATKIF